MLSLPSSSFSADQNLFAAIPMDTADITAVINYLTSYYISTCEIV
jgi:hypothetical protein